MHDVELWLCTHPVHPRLEPLLDQLSEWTCDRALREPLVAELRALVAAELAGVSARWTPHYDSALTTLAAATDEELLDPAWGYETDPIPYSQLGWPRFMLAIHAGTSAQLAEARDAGARTLAAAFDLVTIGTDELARWFALCPDPAALDLRLRVAAAAYLRATREDSPALELEVALLEAVEIGAPEDTVHLLRMQWFATHPSLERQCALGVLIAEGNAAGHDYTAAPLALFELLGNPFDPRL